MLVEIRAPPLPPSPFSIQHHLAYVSECQGFDPDNNTDYISWLANNGGADATDLCGNGVTWSHNASTQTWGGTPCERTITITFTATDDCSNATSTTATFTIEDTTAPDITTAASNGSAECEGTDPDANSYHTAWLAANGGAAAADLCGNNVTWTNNTTTAVWSGVGCNNVITIEFYATDDCGNTSVTTATFTIVDTTEPEWVTAPGDLDGTYECSDLAGIAAAQAMEPVAFDLCGNGVTNIVKVSGSFVPGSVCPQAGTYTNTWTVTDDCGNTSVVYTQVITIIDTEDPVINTSTFPAAPVVLNAGMTNCGALYTWPVPAVSDNCDPLPILTVSFSDPTVTHSWLAGPGSGSHQAMFNKGTTTVTYHLIDACGNSSQASFDVTVVDVTPPSISAVPSNITINNIPGQCYAQVWWTAPTASDNCPGVGMTTTHIPGSLFPAGQTTTVTYTATDGVGLVTTASFDITVIDNEAPVVITQDITVQLDATGNVSITTADVNNGSYDNCGIVNMELDVYAFTCANVGQNTVTLTAWDLQGNSTAVTAIVTVEDNVAPDVYTQNITVQLDAAGTVTILATDVDDNSWDACGIASYDLDKHIFTCADVGSNTVTLTVEDVNGNIATATAIVTVEDNVAPNVITQNITVDLNAVTGLVSITPAMIDNGSSDACGIATMTLDITDFDCSDVGSNTVTLTVTDVNNNTASATAVVTVQDVTPPTALCQNLTLYLDASGNTSTTAAAVDNGSFDNCGIQSLVLSQTAFVCGDVGVNTVTLTVTDNNNLVSTCTAEITVVDNIPPTVITQDITVYLDAAGSVSITTGDINNGSYDNCGIASMSLDETDFDCSHVGANTVTLTVVDVNNLSASATAVVTVVDNIYPTALCQNVTLYLDASGNTSTTASAVDNGSFDNCGILSLVLSQTDFNCSHVGFNPVTLTVTDVNNNTSTCTATVEVIDNIIPTALCQDLTLYLDATGNTSTTAAAVDNGSFDNCGIQSLALSQTAFDCSHLGFNTVTLLVTDVNNNTNTCTAQIEVVDNLKPIVITQPYTVYLDATGNTSMVALDIDGGSTDNCTIISYTVDKWTFDCTDVGNVTVTLTVTDQSGNYQTGTAIVTVVDNLPPTVITQDITVYLDANGTVTITAMDIDNFSTDNCVIDTYALDQYTFTCAETGPNTVTLTVTDVNGNSASATAIVTVVDNIFPTITCATPVNPYKVNSTCEYVVPGTDLDATGDDNCSYTITHDYMTSVATTLQGAAFPIGTTTVVWTIEDASGNSVTCSIDVVVEGFTVSGNINYYNTPLTAMNNVDVTLTQGSTVFTTTTDVNGFYTIDDVCMGTYDVSFNTIKPVGGINATDAGQANTWGTLGTKPYIEMVRYRAGDVSYDGNVFGNDASQILGYFVTSGGAAFAAPAWSFWNVGETVNGNGLGTALPTITVSGDQTEDFYALVTGDFNRSFVPGNAKTTGNVLLHTNGAVTADVNEVVEVPILAGHSMDVSAASLILHYPADKAEVLGVTLGNQNLPVQYDADNGTLRIGWYNMFPMALAEGDALFTLTLRTTAALTNGESITFTLAQDPLIELADANNQVIPAAVLSMNTIESTVSVEEPLVTNDGNIGLMNYPNPFNHTTTFAYTIPVDGKVVLEVYDLLGRKVAEPVNETQTAGEYTFTVDTQDLRPGIYTATLHLTTKGATMTRSIKIVSQK